MKTSGDKIIEPSVIEPQATPGKAILGEGGSKMLAKKTTKGESSPHEITSEGISGENIPAKKVMHGVVDPATFDERKFMRNKQPANTNTLDWTSWNRKACAILLSAERGRDNGLPGE